MRKNFYTLFLLVFALFYSSVVCAEGEWTNLYTNDFGGNSETDELYGPAFENASELMVNAFETAYGDLPFEYDESLAYGYCVLKHSDGNSDWYTGGDHTYANDREKGYFLLLNPGNSGKKEAAYICKLTDLVKGNDYRFTAYVANLLRPHTNVSAITLSLGVYGTSDPNSELVTKNAYKTIELNLSDGLSDSQSLDWQKLQLEFTLDKELSAAYFIVTMEAPKTNGWDFAIDDVSIDTKALSPELSSCESETKDVWMAYANENNLIVLPMTDGEINVTDVNGKYVGTFMVKAESVNKITLSAGVYFVRLNAEVKKVLVY